MGQKVKGCSNMMSHLKGRGLCFNIDRLPSVFINDNISYCVSGVLIQYNTVKPKLKGPAGLLRFRDISVLKNHG